MEPMLLEDYKFGQVPQIVANLLNCFRQHNLNPEKNDMIVGFAYLLMVEYGFTHKYYRGEVTNSDFNYQRLIEHSRTFPPNYKSADSYEIEFCLRVAPDLICKMICVPVSDDLLINCTIPRGGCFSLLVDPLTYFTSSKVSLHSTNFQNLDKLSLKFKQTIAWPAKFTMVQMGGGLCASLQHLPCELFTHIMTYLTTSEILNVAMTCRDMCIAIRDPILWIKVLHSYYSKKRIHKTPSQLKSQYELKYSPALTKIMSCGYVFRF